MRLLSRENAPCGEGASCGKDARSGGSEAAPSLPRQKSPLGNDFPVRGEGTRGTRAALGQVCGHSTGCPWRPRSFRRPEVQRGPCPGEGRGCPQPLRPPSKAAPGSALSVQLFLAFPSPFVSPPGACCNLLCD